MRFLAELRKKFPPGKNVAVRSVVMDDCAEISYGGGKFVILVNRNKSYQIMVDSVIHEWAHLLTWFDESYEQNRVDHSAAWGIAYAKIYSEFSDLKNLPEPR